MVLAIYKFKEFEGGREMRDRSYPLSHIWQVVGPSKGVLWSHCTVPLLDECPEQMLYGWTTT